ncbi:MAG: tRNA (adenosine(37)-N6)-threonylcarbamoyltransferase complex ATPase subunit type 1 TsaE [Candidatus Omnitrophota bacterium]
MKKLVFSSVEETMRFGARLGRLIKKGDCIALTGQLGAGKTTLVKGIAKGMGVKDPQHVNSPSFVILKEHKGKMPLYHFDVYRLNDPEEMDTVGYKDFFYGDGASVVEWADKIREILPEEYLNIELSVAGEEKREANISARGKRYERLLRRLA